MERKPETKVYIALIHHPVLNKKGDLICSAVTNLDIHDIARAGKTYGAEKDFIVTTLPDQKILVDKIVKHWTIGRGGDVNPDRREALKLISIVDSIEDAVEEIRLAEKTEPVVVATTARKDYVDMPFKKMRVKMENGGVYLLLFGTAWGLSDDVLSESDHVLAPIQTGSDYNHLSVRSAVSIVLDRLIARERL